MNNTMTICNVINEGAIKDYEEKLFKRYEAILNDKKNMFEDKGFQLVMFKQRYDKKSKKWFNDKENDFNNIKYEDGYKCIVSFALYKNGQNYIVNNKKVLNNYYVIDITRRTELDNKWIVKYFVINDDLFKDIEYYYVLTSIM